MADATWGEWLTLVGIGVVIPFCMIFVFILGLNHFVALKAPPSSRAAWTAGIAYLITVVLLTFGSNGTYSLLWTPILCLPGLVVNYLLQRKEYRRAWVDSLDDLPEGVSLANDDWKVGVATLAGLILTATIATLARRYMLAH
jgi:hypothetical protein